MLTLNHSPARSNVRAGASSVLNSCRDTASTKASALDICHVPNAIPVSSRNVTAAVHDVRLFPSLKYWVELKECTYAPAFIHRSGNASWPKTTCVGLYTAPAIPPGSNGYPPNLPLMSITICSESTQSLRSQAVQKIAPPRHLAVGNLHRSIMVGEVDATVDGLRGRVYRQPPRSSTSRPRRRTTARPPPRASSPPLIANPRSGGRSPRRDRAAAGRGAGRCCRR